MRSTRSNSTRSCQNLSAIFAVMILSLLLVCSSAFLPSTITQRPTNAYRALSRQSTSLYVSAFQQNSTIALGDHDDEDKIDIALKGSQLKPKPLTHEDGPVRAIHSIDEFLDAVENTEENALVIVKFHAKFCRVCSRVILKFKKLAHKYQENGSDVPIRFISVETTANPKIIEKLGVKKFPFLQIYRNRECVASFGTGPAHNFAPVVGGTVEQKLQMSIEEWENFRTEFKDPIADNLKNLDLLRLESTMEQVYGNGVEDDSIRP